MIDDCRHRFSRPRDRRVETALAGVAALFLAACGEGSDYAAIADAPVIVPQTLAATRSTLVTPPTPTGLFVNPAYDDATGDTSAYIGWDSAPGATGYRVRYKINGGTLHVNTVGATPGTQLTGLSPGDQLTVTVVAFSSGGLSSATDPVNATLPHARTTAEDTNYNNAADYSEEASNGGVAVVVLQHGRKVFERYADGYNNEPHILASGTKSFSCALEAFAEQDGLLNLTTNVSSRITDWQSDPDKSPITVLHLLGLNSGMHGNPAYSPRTVPTLDTYNLAVNEIDSGNPAGGNAFIYDPLSFQNFALLFQISSGGTYGSGGAVSGGTDPVDYLQTKLFTPLGIASTSYGWTRDVQGHSQMAGGASFSATDWLKYGQFMLQKGTWQSARHLPAATVDYCTAGTGTGGYTNPSFHGYGLTWWLNRHYDGTYDDDVDIVPAAALPIDPDDDQIAPDVPEDMYMAAGAGFQRLYVIPSLDLVVVRFADDSASSDYSDNIFLGKLIGTVS
jgi:CubicO group peptidase (beta-lactamase class C family)